MAKNQIHTIPSPGSYFAISLFLPKFLWYFTQKWVKAQKVDSHYSLFPFSCFAVCPIFVNRVDTCFQKSSFFLIAIFFTWKGLWAKHKRNFCRNMEGKIGNRMDPAWDIILKIVRNNFSRISYKIFNSTSNLILNLTLQGSGPRAYLNFLRLNGCYLFFS